MTDRRGFMKTMLTALGVAATARNLGPASSDIWNRLPKQTKAMIPPGNSFLLERVTFMNSTGMVTNPHLLIDEWEFEPKILVHKEPVTITFKRPIVLHSIQRIALLAKENTMVGLHGWRVDYELEPLEFEHMYQIFSSPNTLKVDQVVPYVYWLRV